MDYAFKDNLTWPKEDIGIYEIFCKADGKSYVGKTHNRDGFSARWVNHRADLRRGKHCCQHLQNAYNKYGEESFVFRVLEVCERTDNLKIKERDWMVKLDVKANGFNIRGYEEDSFEEAMWKRIPFELIDPDGNFVSGNDLQAFSKNLSLRCEGFRQVLRGNEWSYKGYTSTNPDFQKPSTEKRIVSPSGELFVFRDSVNSFAKRMGLDGKSLNFVISGVSSHHRGWTVENPSEEHRSGISLFLKFNSPFSYIDDSGMTVSGNSLSEYSKSVGIPARDLYNKFIKKKVFVPRVVKIKEKKIRKKKPREVRVKIIKEKIIKIKKPIGGTLTSPIGEIVNFEDIRVFAKENNLWLGGVYRTLQGKQNSVMGWTSDKTNTNKLPRRRSLEQIDPNTKERVKIWASVSEAAKDLPHNGNFLTNVNAICLRCREKSDLPYKGFIWRYYKEVSFI